MFLIGTASLFGWIFYVNQSFFLYRPGHRQDEVLLPSHPPSTAHLHFDNVTFTSKDGATLNGYWIKAPSSSSSSLYSTTTHPTLLYSHGNTGNIGRMLPVAERLQSTLNCNVFVYDYRGFGRSRGAPYESGVKMDAEAAFEYAYNHADTDKTRFILYGQSLGGAVTFYLANQHSSQLQKVIVENSFYSMQHVIPNAVPSPLAFFKFYCFEQWPSYKELQLMCRKEVVPEILLLSGSVDKMIPPQHLKDLVKVAKETRPEMKIELVEFPYGCHFNTHLQPGYYESIKEFVEK